MNEQTKIIFAFCVIFERKLNPTHNPVTRCSANGDIDKTVGNFMPNLGCSLLVQLRFIYIHHVIVKVTLSITKTLELGLKIQTENVKD